METTLRVQVHDALTLDAGTLVAAEPTAATGVTVRPPAVPMVDQVLAFLEASPEVPARAPSPAELAAATVAVCLRYGTWFALLSDEHRPALRVGRDASRIRNAEMARINVEASAALERWLEVRREGAARFHQLVARALHYLPPQPPPGRRRSRPRTREPDAKVTRGLHLKLPALTTPALADRVTTGTRAVQPALFAARAAEVQAHPTRVLSNALVFTTWRDGPVETVAAGTWEDFPLDTCRLSARERDRLLRHTIAELAVALPAVEAMIDETGRSWEDKVLPFHLLAWWDVTPEDWTLTERSWEIEVRGRREPGS